MRRFLLLRTELFMWQGFYLLNYRVHDVYINSTRILFQSGARATRAFLRYYCQKNPFYQRRQSALLSKGFFDGLRSRKTEGSPNALKPGVLNGRLATSKVHLLINLPVTCHLLILGTHHIVIAIFLIYP